MNSIELHVDTTDVARPPLFEDLDEERPELLRLYRSWRDLAASGRLDDGDELQDMSAKRFQALADLQMLLLFGEERPELLRQYRSGEDLAAPGRLDDGDELQDMRTKRFQAPRSPDAVNFIPLERVGS